MSIRAIADDAYSHNVVQQYCKKKLFKPAGSPAVALNPYAAPVDEEEGDLFYIESEKIRTTIITRVLEKDLVNWLTLAGISCTYSEKASYKGNRVEFPNHTLQLMEPADSKYAWQNTASVLIVEEDHNVFELQTGSGKCLHDDTKIRIPGGWRRMGDLRIGDRVIGDDGLPTTVTGVYPNGVVDLYDVTFEDGRTVKACGEHLWGCFYINTSPRKRWGVRNTLEMQRLIAMPNPRVYIPLPEPEDTQEKEFTVHPYLLGVLLGDGSLRRCVLGLSNPEVEILERVCALLPEDMTLTGGEDGLNWRLVGTKHGNNTLLNQIRDLELCNTKSNEKFIPSAYLEGSIEQRYELLRGLMDTDGYISSNGTTTYTTVSSMLAHGVQDLVRSLGGIAKITTKVTNYTYKGERKRGQLAYNVNIRMKKPSLMFHLPRKLARTNDDNQYSKDLKLRVKSIVKCAPASATCISVDNAKALYVAEDWIVTHNTKTAEKGVIRKGVIPAYITKPAYMAKWRGDVEEDMGLVVDTDFFVIDSVDRLMNMIHYGGDPATKAYLISSFCIDNYIHRWAANPEDYVDPDQIWEALGVGICVYDEAHEVFRMQYWSVLALAPNCILDLSATLLPDDPFLKARYAERFPTESRLSMDYNAYVDVIGLAFTMEDRKIAQRINRQPMYQHHVFESKVMKQKRTLNRYFDMLYKILDKWYLRDRKEGQKALIMLATRNMCTEFWQYVKLKCPDLDVQRYIEGDKYEVAKEADIIISTPGKSGTGVDYIGLVLNIIAVSVNASQKSMQMLGRTRDACITRWGIHPKVIYPICTNIPKQVTYYNRRRKLLAGRVNSMITMNTGIVI